MTLGQNGDMTILVIFGDKMANLIPIDSYIKVYAKEM